MIDAIFVYLSSDKLSSLCKKFYGLDGDNNECLDLSTRWMSPENSFWCKIPVWSWTNNRESKHLCRTSAWDQDDESPAFWSRHPLGGNFVSSLTATNKFSAPLQIPVWGICFWRCDLSSYLSSRVSEGFYLYISFNDCWDLYGRMMLTE